MNIHLEVLRGKPTRYLHVEDATKPTLVYLMGALQSIETEKKIHQGLAPSFNYYCVELPGTGYGQPLPAYYSFEFIADCLHDFLLIHHNQPVHLVACSYAAAIALSFAKRYPEQLNRLVLAGAASELPKHGLEDALHCMSESVDKPLDFVQRFLNMLSQDEQCKKTLTRVIMRKLGSTLGVAGQAYTQNTVRLMAYKAQGLESIHCPTLCITGEHDPFVTPEACLQLAQCLSQGYFTTIPNSDHLFAIQQTQMTVDTMLQFLLEGTVADHGQHSATVKSSSRQAEIA